MTTSTFQIDFGKEVRDAIEIIKLNKTKMKEIAGKKSSTKIGIVFIVVPIVLNALLSFFSVGGSWGGYYTYLSVLPIISLILGILILSYVAEKFFKGKGDHESFFRVISYSCLLLWINTVFLLLSTLGLWGISASLLYTIPGLISLWIIVVTYFALIEIHQLSSENAVITIIVGFIASIIINSILQAFYPKPTVLTYDIDNIRFEDWEDYLKR